MPKGDKNILSIEMRNLIIESLAIDDPAKTPHNATFKMYGYKGTIVSLLAIVEHLAISRNILDKVVDLPRMAWGVPGENLIYGSNTNFSEDELNTFTEEIYFLSLQNVISPGAYREYGSQFPYFHVTKYGLKCLENREILPYDQDGYLARIKTAPFLDDWELFYITQSVACYNAGTYNAAMIMLGLAGEYLAERMIENMGTFLKNKEPVLYTQYETSLRNKTKISQKYSEYENILKEAQKVKDAAGNYIYPVLQSLSPTLDVAAKSIYSTYLRLTRNEMAHPASLIMDKIESLTILIAFVKYSDIQHKYLNFYISNS